ncbi:MBL fold metallo-hydrolase [Sphingorhabdus sp. Alg239-R122]|uniref:MBL fold metallo-hydrolase n=1 Tax=Sphingorhabdus sp. Alg239-R122 TaxID=2305989 RepID=UPI0013DCA98C|nr:MBL fold metallo-hydrolase [Sphingorhabdus sp. Alg239-R122]
MKLTILGCGTSAGVPRVGHDWGDCNPGEPRNRRSRVSIVVENRAGQRILVDTSPDLRMQLLDNQVDTVDAVLWTHDHADHCHGIDDLRAIFHRRRVPLPGYGRGYTMRNLKSRFSYIFKGNKGYPSIIEPHILRREEVICDIRVRTVDQPHGPVSSTGYRFESDNSSIVYATDFSKISDDMVALYMDCDILIADCLRKEPHPTHAHLDMALELGKQCNARRTILTHMDKSMDYKRLQNELADGTEPAFDGMQVEL